METRGILAQYAAGLLTVWASSQVPHQIRQFVAELLDLPVHRVRVVAPDVGGGFGAKLIVYPEDMLVPFLAVRLGRPVRWLEDRLEHMMVATQERVQVHDVTVGFDDEGRLLAFCDHFVHDNGATAARRPSSSANGVYDFLRASVTGCGGVSVAGESPAGSRPQ